MKLIIAVAAILMLYQENNPPVIAILSPKANAVYDFTSPLRYSVQVSDKEDGDTRYDEIPSAAILVEARVVDDTSKAASFRKDRMPLQAMIASNCMNCHTFRNKLIGPSFAEISNKRTDLNQLVLHVKQGSTGIWGNAVMPSHPELTPDEIRDMVQWITKFGHEKNVEFYTGTEGSIKIAKPENMSPKASLLITASYADKGKAIGEKSVLVPVKR